MFKLNVRYRPRSKFVISLAFFCQFIPNMIQFISKYTKSTSLSLSLEICVVWKAITVSTLPSMWYVLPNTNLAELYHPPKIWNGKCD